MEIGASELVAFRVKIDLDRGLVIDIDSDDGLSTSKEGNSRIVETIQFSDTTINANERMWRLSPRLLSRRNDSKSTAWQVGLI